MVDELQRRRELARLSKPELIDQIITLERGIDAAIARVNTIDVSFRSEP